MKNSRSWGARRYGLKMYGKAVHTIFQKLTSSYSYQEVYGLWGCSALSCGESVRIISQKIVSEGKL